MGRIKSHPGKITLAYITGYSENSPDFYQRFIGACRFTRTQFNTRNYEKYTDYYA